MNKKFLSAILFGALMVTSTGTFVSCKDYDDDIDAINSELTDIKSQLAALQSKVDAGNYVTNITKAENGINVSFSNGTTTFVETGVAVEEDECYASAVTVENGEWVIYKADGTSVKTGIPASGVIAVKNDKGQWVLSVYNASGEIQTITLPTAASLISEVEVEGFLYSSAFKKYIANDQGTSYYYKPVAKYAQAEQIDYNFTIVGSLNSAQNAWNAESMTKKLSKGQALSTIAALNSSMLVRIAPASVDASELEFAFVNSQMGGVDIELGTPEAYTGLLTSRAVSENGLWSIPVTAKEGVVYNSEDDYLSQFHVKDEKTSTWKDVKFALKEKEGFVSNFDLTFQRNTTIPLTSGVEEYVNATLGKEASAAFLNPDAVYDAHMHFAEADVIRWGIQYSGNGVDFTVTNLNDELTIPTFEATVHYVDLKGQVLSEVITVVVEKNVNTTVYDSSNIKLNANNSKNNFSVSLDNMFNTLGNDASVLWKNDVDEVVVNYYRVKEGNELVDQEIVNNNLSVQFLAANNAVVTGDNLGKAVKAKVNVKYESALDRTKQYYALIKFYRTIEGQTSQINTIKVPFTISIPTLVELLNKEQVVFGGTTDGTAVLNEYDYALDNNAVQYSLKYAFNGLADSFAAATMELIVDPNQKIADGTLMKNLVNMVRGNEATAIVEFNKDNNGHKKAYNTPINILIKDGAKYLGVYAYTPEERAEAAFTLKLVSPIEQGTLTAKNGENAVIEVVATEDGTAKLKESDLIAKTYAGIAYNIFMTKGTTNGAATKYSSPYLKPIAVKFVSTNENVFKVDADGTPATLKDGAVVAEGYTTITPMNVAHTDAVPVKVTVTDVWGYAKEVKVNVKVKPSTEE